MIGKDDLMNTSPNPGIDKKLRNLRKILWIVFAAISITILLVFSLSVPVAMVINQATNFLALFSKDTGMLLLSLVAVVLGKIIITGVICFVIYQIVKYRLDRDDDLFL
jgi:multisubunit Na+/H+ antiporter MnhB subunit